MRRVRSFAGAVLCMLMALPTQGWAVEEITLNCPMPQWHYICTDWMSEIARRIESASAGGLKVNGQTKMLAPLHEQAQLFSSERIDMGVVAIQSTGALGFSLLPLAGPASSAEAGKELWDIIGARDEGTFDLDGYITLSVAFGQSGVFASTGEPLPKLSDVKVETAIALVGLTHETFPNFSKVSANEAFASLYRARATGEKTALVFAGQSLSGLEAYKLGDHIEAISRIEGPFLRQAYRLVITKARWEALDGSQKAVLKKAFDTDWAQWAGARADAARELTETAFKRKGILGANSDTWTKDVQELRKKLEKAWLDADAYGDLDQDERKALISDFK